MKLKDKLARLPPPKQHVLDDLRNRIREVLAESAPASVPVHVPVAREGRMMVRTNYLEPHHHHGKIPLARALSVEAHLVAELALDVSIVPVDLSSAVFLDTETTGLSGAGIIPFLIGLGWFEDQSFVIEQLFLEDLGEEPTMLDRVVERIERASCVVTYNGKSFDWPQIVNRCALSRIDPPPARPHVDLLHCARRIYRPRLGGVRLVEIEEQVLGMRRERDISGAEIPSLYWSFLRHRNEAAIAPIIEHNANDVIALAALLAHLAERFATVHTEDDPIDQLARAKLAYRAKDLVRAEQFARAAGEGGGQPDVAVEAYGLLGLFAKRRGELAAAERAFTTGLDATEGDLELAAPIHLELAKLYEHRLKDFASALLHAQSTKSAEGEAEQIKRIGRLEKKLGATSTKRARADRRAW